MKVISKRRNFAGTAYAIDEAQEEKKFNNIPNVLRDVADKLEENDFSEDVRLEAIRTIMPLIGKMRAGIEVNEEEEEEIINDDFSDEDVSYDNFRAERKAYFKLQEMGMDFKNKEEFFDLKKKYPNSIKYLVMLGQGKGNADDLYDKIADIFNGVSDEEEDDDMVALNEECTKKKVIRRKVAR